MFNNFISLSVLSSTYTWYTSNHLEVFLTLNIQTEEDDIVTKNSVMLFMLRTSKVLLLLLKQSLVVKKYVNYSALRDQKWTNFLFCVLRLVNKF